MTTRRRPPMVERPPAPLSPQELVFAAFVEFGLALSADPYEIAGFLDENGQALAAMTQERRDQARAAALARMTPAALADIAACVDLAELVDWGQRNKAAIGALPKDMRDAIAAAWTARRDTFRDRGKGKAA